MPTASQAISSLEDRLAERVGRSYCIATGSGTMALTLALRALALPPGSEVVVPSLCCPAVPFAVAYANLVPVFCDVALADYNATVGTVDAVASDRTRVIIGVHLFGRPAPLDDLILYARSRSFVVIEDAAQAFGGSCLGRMVGQFGAMSITSFGPKKIISTGGGGAVFTDERETADDLRRLRQSCRAHGSFVRRLGLKMYSQVDPTGNRSRGLSRRNVMRVAPHLFRWGSFQPMQPQWAEDISRSLDELNEMVASRNRMAALYQRLLKSDAIIHPEVRDGGTCFRYSVLLKGGDRSRVRVELLKRGIWVSTLYPALHQLYGSPGGLDVTEYVAPRIVNFPVEPSLDEEAVGRVAEVALELISAP